MHEDHEDAEIILALMARPGWGRATIHQALPHLADLRRHTEQHSLRGARHLLRAASDRGVQAIPFTSPAYPAILRTLSRGYPPPLLFIQGDPGLLRPPMAAIVGARHASNDGERLAAECAETFATEGIPTVSGGARGIDLAAHHATVRAGGATVIVLPQGLLTYHAPDEIHQAVQRGGALLLSGFRPDAPWETHAAVTRNATISALARLVCIIEPKRRGGSIRTAQCALDGGKAAIVYCIPEQRDTEEWLLKAGAERLPTEDGHVIPDRLLGFWSGASTALRGQALLDYAPDPPRETS